MTDKKRKISKAILFFLGWITMANSVFAQSPKLQVLTINELKQRIQQGADTAYVINFWATWCKPCVEEMPILESIKAFHKGKPVKVILLSLDFTDQIETRLIPFIHQNALKNEIIVLAEDNPNNWIPMVNSSWSGVIPACWFIFKGREKFHEGQITLKQIIVMCKSNF
jgi:thiol-disulfide isomerase/thioredoxin